MPAPRDLKPFFLPVRDSGILHESVSISDIDANSLLPRSQRSIEL